MIICNAQLFPMVDKETPNGYLRVEAGKIASLGAMEHMPLPAQGEEVYDAKGALLFPGFLDIHCHIGLFGDSVGVEGADGNEISDPISPQLRALDGVNPMDRYFAQSAAAGVTCVVTGPGSTNPIAGTFTAMKTYGRCVDHMALRPQACMKFALGENPKMTYRDRDEGPMTRMATAALIREALYKAQEYRRKKALQQDVDYDAKCEALLPVVRGETPAHFHAHRADDILTAMRIAKEFDLDYVIVHGTEGHLIADILAKERARVICGPLLTDRSKPELYEQNAENPAILHRAGVSIAICTDHPEVPLNLLSMSASYACRAGLEKNTALRAITIDAARIAGLDKRVGSLAVGKDADMVLYSAHPFDMESRVLDVWIDGQRLTVPTRR